jgi:hypothetical protein
VVGLGGFVFFLICLSPTAPQAPIDPRSGSWWDFIGLYMIRGFKMADHGRRRFKMADHGRRHSRTELPVRGHARFEKDTAKRDLSRLSSTDVPSFVEKYQNINYHTPSLTGPTSWERTFVKNILGY